MSKKANPEGRFFKVLQAFIKSPAYREISGDALKLYYHLEVRHDGKNNGLIRMSAREAGELLGRDEGHPLHPQTVAKAFRDLQRVRLIRIGDNRANFDTRKQRRANTWHLTFYEAGPWPALRWPGCGDGEVYDGRSARQKKNSVKKCTQMGSQSEAEAPGNMENMGRLASKSASKLHVLGSNLASKSEAHSISSHTKSTSEGESTPDLRSEILFAELTWEAVQSVIEEIQA